MSLVDIFEPDTRMEELSQSTGGKRQTLDSGSPEDESLLQQPITQKDSPYRETTVPMSSADKLEDTSSPSKTMLPSKDSKLQFRSPREDCSPEDCCCCFYFLYLLFNQEIKPPAYDANPAVSGIRALAARGSGSKSRAKDVTDSARAPGYSYFKNISTGSSIDSKSSWLFERLSCPTDSSVPPADDHEKHDMGSARDPSDDDNESDGWMVGQGATAVVPNQPTSGNSAVKSTAIPSTDQSEGLAETAIDMTASDAASGLLIDYQVENSSD